MEPVDLPTLTMERVVGARAAAVPSNFFPSQVEWRAAVNSDRVARVTAAEALRGYRPHTVDVVQVPKLDQTTRPAADMALQDRLVYSALVGSIQEQLYPGLVNFTDSSGEYGQYETFEQFPLTQVGARYVLEADVAAYYMYVDHELLATDLIGLTGAADEIDALVSLLDQWMGAQRGLPQGPQPSAALADMYISPVDRALQRAGIAFSRYSDDFRIVAESWPALKQARLYLESALADLGLTMASGKMWPLKIETYRRFVTEVAAPSLHRDLSPNGGDEYDDFVQGWTGRRPISSQDLQHAERVLEEQLSQGVPDLMASRFTKSALRTLALARSPRATEMLPVMLQRFPHLTGDISRYLAQLMGSRVERSGLEAIVSWIMDPGFAFPWQLGWLVRPAAFASHVPSEIIEWAQARLADDTLPWFARGQTAIALAAQGELPARSRFVDIFEIAPATTRADLVAAVVIAQPSWSTQFLAGVRGDAVLDAVADLPPDAYTTWI